MPAFLRILTLALAAAALPLAAADLPPLGQNGAVFTVDGVAEPMRVCDLTDLLVLPPEAMAGALEKATLAGFNAVSFNGLLVGGRGMFTALKAKPDPARVAAYQEALKMMRLRLLYPVPVLFDEPSALALEKALGLKPGGFFTDPKARAWQELFMRALAASADAEGTSLAAQENLGLWLLYRGGAAADADAVASWGDWAAKRLESAGLGQPAGLWVWPRGAGRKPAGLAAYAAAASRDNAVRFVVLPPLAVGAAKSMAQAVEAAANTLEVPALLSADPASFGQGEGRERLLGHQGLAGLMAVFDPGAWADEAAPLWPAMDPEDRHKPKLVALAFRGARAEMRGKAKAVLTLEVNRPAGVRIAWGGKMPLKHHLVSLDPGLVHEADLWGLKPGQTILVEARGESEKWGRAMLRPVKVTIQPEAPAKDAGVAPGKTTGGKK